jgi:hypothetical protein
MTTKATMKPGQKGTKRLTDTYGERLVCVRYRYDAAAGKRFITVDLIEEESDWSNEPPVSTKTEDFAPSQHLAVRVEYWESELREKVKSAGGIWPPRHKLWAMRYDDIIALRLESRVVAGDELRSES